MMRNLYRLFITVATLIILSEQALAVDPTCKSTLLSLQTQAKTTGRISVKDAGAVGDSTQDDSTAIQDAIDCAFAGGAGYTVYFPPGGYKITRGIVVHRNVDLVGEGIGWSSVIKPSALLTTDTAALYIDGSTQTDGWAFKNTINGLNIDMLNLNGKSAIKINSAYNIRLVDTYIRSNAVATDPATPSIDIIGSNHITLEHIVIFGTNTGAGIGLNIKDSWVTALNPDIEGHLSNIIISETASGKGKLSMYGGYIERFGQYGIRFNNTGYNRIDGVVMKIPNSSPHGISFNSSTNNALTGLTILCGIPTCQAIVGSSGNPITNTLIQGTNTP